MIGGIAKSKVVELVNYYKLNKKYTKIMSIRESATKKGQNLKFKDNCP
jgi:hypothetical protein